MTPFVSLSQMNELAIRLMLSAYVIVPGMLCLIALRAYREWREDR